MYIVLNVQCTSSDRAHLGINMMLSICHLNIYFSRNWRKYSQNGEKQKFKNPKIYLVLVGHEILNKVVYFAKRYCGGI